MRRGGLSRAEAVSEESKVFKSESPAVSQSSWPSLFEEDVAKARSKSLFAGFPVPKSPPASEKALLKSTTSMAPPILEPALSSPSRPAAASPQNKQTVSKPAESPELKEIPKEAPAAQTASVAPPKAPNPAGPPHKEKTSDSPSKSESPKIPATKNSGYTIRSENGVLVVYDAEGKVVLRNDGKKKVKIGSETRKESEPEKKQAFNSEEEADSFPIEPLVFVEVKKGENLSVIASRYPGVTAADLMKVNRIEDPHSIQIGQKIWIPVNMDGVCHRVEEGETISELVNRYKVPSAIRVCDINGLPRTQNRLEPGSLIVLPGADKVARHEFTSGSKAIRQDLSGLKGKVTWAWPVDGEFMISSPWGLRVDPFSRGKVGGIGGEKIRQTMHHGIDMAIPTGTPVYAARAGVVTDAGRKRLHGNSIKILHDDNWTTIYSHNSELLVKEGDRVEQGQLIAYSGSTGRSTGPHLHFEIRRPNQESMNPRRLLPSRPND